MVLDDSGKARSRTIGDDLKNTGTEFGFWMGVEVSRPLIIRELRTWLERYSDSDLRKMMQENKLPSVPPKLFAEATSYAKYVDKIEIVELLEEYLGPARPSIIHIMNEMGEKGTTYMLDLHKYLIECVKSPEKARIGLSPKSEAEMVVITCNKCNQSFPVHRDKVTEIEKCPLCGASAKGKEGEPPV